MILWNGYDANLDPRLVAGGNRVLGESFPYTLSVTRGKASVDAQQVLYLKYLAGGPLAARPTHSAHCQGMAFDFGVIEDGAHISWAEGPTHPAWPAVWAACAASPDLHSGHEFPPVAPADDDHVELTIWRTEMIPQLRAQGLW